jgi:hypothetical protein
VTLKLWLGLRDTDVGVLVEEVAVVASEVIVRLALVTTKANARVYETGSDVAGSESGAGMSTVVSGGDCLLWLFVSSALRHFASVMKRSRSRNEGSDEGVRVGCVS